MVGGRRDSLKHMMVPTSQNVQTSSVRIVLSLAAMHRFDVWTADVTQAYLQAALTPGREVFITNAPKKFELNPSECLQLLKKLYGLCELGDLWHKTLHDHHVNDLSMNLLDSDKSLYFSLKGDMLSGLSRTYVDDIIRAGDGDFKIFG